MLIFIESKDRDIDFLHHLSKQGPGFEGTEPLTAKRLPEAVRFHHDLSQRFLPARFLPARTAGSNGVVRRQKPSTFEIRDLRTAVTPAD